MRRCSNRCVCVHARMCSCTCMCTYTRAHAVLTDYVTQVHEEVADVDMALAIGKLHSTSGTARKGGMAGWAGKAGSSIVIWGAAAGGSGGGEEDASVEHESAQKGLQRALR